MCTKRKFNRKNAIIELALIKSRGSRYRHENHYYYCKGGEQKPVRLCSMPNFRADLVDLAVWTWVKNLIENPENITNGLRNMQTEAQSSNSRLYERMEIIDQQLKEELQ